MEGERLRNGVADQCLCLSRMLSQDGRYWGSVQWALGIHTPISPLSPSRPFSALPS